MGRPVDAPRAKVSLTPSGRRKSHTENLARGGKRRLAVLTAKRTAPYARPRTFGECQTAGFGTLVHCPFVGCVHHLYLEVDDRFGPSASLKFNFPDREPGELAQSCSLVVAGRGRMDLDRIGALLNLTRERVRVIVLEALAALNANRRVRALTGVEAGAAGPPSPGTRPATRRPR